MVLDGIKTLLEEAKTQRWRLDETGENCKDG